LIETHSSEDEMNTTWTSGSLAGRTSAGLVAAAVAAAMALATPAAARPWHRHHHHHHHRGFGTGAAIGFATGALIGGALAARPRYYAPPAPAYSSAVQYCMDRYRSYDPASGTYLGYDGFRHPCP
jgi:hypothetical protein